jgi:hypothetical protein
VHVDLKLINVCVPTDTHMRRDIVERIWVAPEYLSIYYNSHKYVSRSILFCKNFINLLITISSTTNRSKSNKNYNYVFGPPSDDYTLTRAKGAAVLAPTSLKPAIACRSRACCSRLTRSRHDKVPKDQHTRAATVGKMTTIDLKRLSWNYETTPRNTKTDRNTWDPLGTRLHMPSADARRIIEARIGRGGPYSDFMM